MTLWPLVVYAVASGVLVALMIGLSYVLGQRRFRTAAVEPYESGMLPTGSAWMQFDVKYYLVAMFFVIFDVEALFIFAWAVSLREVGWAGFVEALIFIVILFAGLAYIWAMGALDWGPERSSNASKSDSASGAGEGSS